MKINDMICRARELARTQQCGGHCHHRWCDHTEAGCFRRDCGFHPHAYSVASKVEMAELLSQMADALESLKIEEVSDEG